MTISNDSELPTENTDFVTWLYDGVPESWIVPELWEAAKGLPVEDIVINKLEEVTAYDYWLRFAKDPTHAQVAPEMERINACDLDCPILLHPSGWVMDGFHRLAKAIQAGNLTIKAQRFTKANLPPARKDYLR